MRRAPILNAAGESGGATVFAATTQAPALVAGRAEGAPTQGGLASFLKTSAIEMAAVACRAVHLDGSDARGRLPIEHMLAEIGAVERPCRSAHTRAASGFTLSRASRLPAGTGVPLDLGPDSVFLITGGARGVTAEIAIALAQRFALA